MNVQQRKSLLVQLGNYMAGNAPAWQTAKEKATAENPWFIPEFIELSVSNIVGQFLQPGVLDEMISRYRLTKEITLPKSIGIVMAGNIPLVGFHDLLCVFISGHRARIKLSSRDAVLLTHLVGILNQWEASISDYMILNERIPACDAYIATGSNNSARYFDYYFKKYPSIIRKNRTSVAVLKGNETAADLEKLSDDVFLYFGLGCRNVTQLYVPENYDFVPLLDAFRKYKYLSDHNKYRNNYDYNLAVHILNNEYYMTNQAIILVKDGSPFSRISELNYQFYSDAKPLLERLTSDPQIQCIAGTPEVPLGKTQCPGIFDFADGVDTVKFLREL
jgi:hypothetical protein